MIDEDYFKYREANLLAQWDKKLATVLKIQELEAELKEFSYMFGVNYLGRFASIMMAG